MLQQLSIKNIALIEDAIIEFDKGFNVLSGETGAGKSIIIDSLNLVLGERADKELVRSGTQKARVEGVFFVENNPSVIGILDELGIECEDGLLIILRELTADGKSVCRVNGSAVTLGSLKKITDKLADIHGQHEHQLLLNSDCHIDFLDSFGGEAIASQKDVVCKAYNEYEICLDKLNGNWGSAEERARKIEMLEFQIDEIDKAQIVVGQEQELKERAELLNNADKIKSALSDVISLIGGEALDNIRSASSVLDKVCCSGEVIDSLRERLNSAFYEFDDITHELDSFADSIEDDPYELERIEDRLANLKKLFRKYGATEEEVLKFYDDACLELDRLKNAEDIIDALEKQADQLKTEYFRQADKLSKIRHNTATAFEKRIKDELAQLGMKNALLEVDFNNEDNITPSGYDIVEFMFSANKGEPVKHLSKIISGGEMSRFMLAIKSVAAEDVTLPTMVFDEIDTGISGNGAQVVAQKIAVLSKSHQIIAITHLPQLASMADRHLLIKKLADGARTHTEVFVLDPDNRKKEIARLSGGEETELALQRAEEIISAAENFKKTI